MTILLPYLFDLCISLPAWAEYLAVGLVLTGGPAGYSDRLLAKIFESFYSHSGRKFLRTISPYNLSDRPVCVPTFFIPCFVRIEQVHQDLEGLSYSKWP